jgi:hypothetical protein
LLLLRVLADDPSILDEASGGQWLIGLTVARLNDRPTPRPWNDDRVDNAKRRPVNWIDRLRKRNQLDETDLEGLFARVARQQEAGEGKPPARGCPTNRRWSLRVT